MKAGTGLYFAAGLLMKNFTLSGYRCSKEFAATLHILPKKAQCIDDP